MKTIRNQLKYPIGLQLPVLLWMGIKDSQYSIFYAVTNRTTNRQQIENALEAVKPYFGPQNMFDCTVIEHR